jgi:hypothetical protein
MNPAPIAPVCAAALISLVASGVWPVAAPASPGRPDGGAPATPASAPSQGQPAGEALALGRARSALAVLHALASDARAHDGPRDIRRTCERVAGNASRILGLLQQQTGAASGPPGDPEIALDRQRLTGLEDADFRLALLARLNHRMTETVAAIEMLDGTASKPPLRRTARNALRDLGRDRALILGVEVLYQRRQKRAPGRR